MHHGGDAGAAKSSQGTEAGAPGSQQPVYSAPAQFGAPRYVVPSGLAQAQAVSMSSLMPSQMMQARGGGYPAAAPGAPVQMHRNGAVLVPTTGEGSAYQVTPEMMYEVRSPSARPTLKSRGAHLRKGPDISQDLSPMLPGRQHHMLRQPPGVVSRSPGTTMRGFITGQEQGAERAHGGAAHDRGAPPGLAGVPTTYDRMRMQNHISYGPAAAMAARRVTGAAVGSGTSQSVDEFSPMMGTARSLSDTASGAPAAATAIASAAQPGAAPSVEDAQQGNTPPLMLGQMSGGMGSPQSMNISPMMQFRPPDRMMDPSWQPGIEPVVASHSGVPMLLKVRFTAPPPLPP